MCRGRLAFLQVVAVKRWTAARGVFGVPALQHAHPLAGSGDGHESVAHLLRLWMKLRVLDAEFSHLPAAMLRAIQDFRKAVMLRDHLALFQHAGRVGKWQARRRFRGSWPSRPRR